MTGHPKTQENSQQMAQRIETKLQRAFCRRMRYHGQVDKCFLFLTLDIPTNSQANKLFQR